MKNRKKEYIAEFDELGFYAPKKERELVRCKNCKYFNDMLYTHCKQSGMHIVSSNDFCAWGEMNAEQVDG